MNRLQLVLATFIFGTIGIFVNYIPLPSAAIAFARGALGVLFLLLFGLILRIEINLQNIKKNLLLLLLSGGAIGFNWIFLFEAYRHTTVATATLCYYMAPIFVMVASPFVLKEKIGVKKLICIGISLVGMVFVNGAPTDGDPLGIIFGIAAAALYASVILMNKKLGEVSAFNRTLVQLAAAALVVLPYTILVEKPDLTALDGQGIGLLLCVGLVHTGLAYFMYFSSVQKLPAQTVAIISYIDPVVAIVLSALLLSQPLTVASATGAVLILAASLVAEWPSKK